ncbi:MAG: TetR/AcrR family transcriptional regulator [Capsulimonadales bacterium]|nr:TetR/AcrR family transcriptional regulator [Capsulimonadales bacterium]
MGTSERRQREKENLRRAILEAARELFVDHGFDNVSMRKIAERIEYSPTTIYLHFKDKEEIFATLVEEGFTLLSERLEPFHIRVADPIERLREGAKAYFGFAREQPHFYRIMFDMKSVVMTESAWEEIRDNAHYRAGVRAFGFIVRCVHEGIAQGKIPHGDASEANILLLSHVVWSSLHGVVSLVLADRLLKMPCDLPETAARLLLDATIDNTLRGLTGK